MERHLDAGSGTVRGPLAGPPPVEPGGAKPRAGCEARRRRVSHPPARCYRSCRSRTRQFGAGAQRRAKLQGLPGGRRGPRARACGPGGDLGRRVCGGTSTGRRLRRPARSVRRPGGLIEEAVRSASGELPSLSGWEGPKFRPPSGSAGVARFHEEARRGPAQRRRGWLRCAPEPAPS